MRRLKYFVRQCLDFLFNNIVVNNILIWFKVEYLFKKYHNPFINYTAGSKTSLQEIAGFSERPEINELIRLSHEDLRRITEAHVRKGGTVLDIGCGPGLYLKDFEHKFSLTGLDISDTMLALAAKELPGATFVKGDFLETTIKGKFDLIFCIGVLIYVTPSKLDAFFNKIAEHLNPDGVLYLNYPHAISQKDTLNANLSYNRYSPLKIARKVSPHLQVIEHHQVFDGREVGTYDKSPYQSENPLYKVTFKNSYLLVAKKR